MMAISFEEALKHGWIQPADVPKQALSKKPGGRKRDAEGDEQVSLLQDFRRSHPDVGHLLIHIPNGGSRKNAYEGWRLKQQGVRAGVSDLLLPVARGGYFGLWIEFKAAPPNNAAISDSQKEWVALMREQGYHAEVCLGAIAAMQVLTAYLRLAPTISTQH